MARIRGPWMILIGAALPTRELSWMWCAKRGSPRRLSLRQVKAAHGDGRGGVLVRLVLRLLTLRWLVTKPHGIFSVACEIHRRGGGAWLQVPVASGDDALSPVKHTNRFRFKETSERLSMVVQSGGYRRFLSVDAYDSYWLEPWPPDKLEHQWRPESIVSWRYSL